MIQGNVQTSKTNAYGYTSYKIDGTWYGADAKSGPRAGEGDQVSFEAYDKPGKDGKMWPTLRLSTLVKRASTSIEAAGADEPGTGQPVSVVKSGGYAIKQNDRDTYWADKAKSDASKDPRIAYFAALERAINFVDLAIRNGAFAAYSKAKDTAKLEVLTQFVGEQTQRIIQESYSQQVTAAPKAVEAELVSDLPAAVEESWQ